MNGNLSARLIPVLMLLVAPAGARGAEGLVAGSEGVYWLGARGTYFGRLVNASLEWSEVGGRWDGVAQDGDESYGWRGRQMWALKMTTKRLVCTFPDVIRAACRVPGGPWLVIAGGKKADAGLLGARLWWWAPETAAVWPSQVDPGLNPFMLRVGQRGGQRLVLVGVRKTAVFDAVFRARPFVYSFSPPRRDLVPRWQGTSFSRPYLDAAWADLNGDDVPELCALEQSRGGRRVLMAYEWAGHGVEGLAQSPALNLGARLRVTRWPGRQQDILICFRHDSGLWRGTAWSWGNSEARPGVLALEETGRTAGWVERPADWALMPPRDSAPGPLLVRWGTAAPRLAPWKQEPAGRRGN